MEFLFKPNIQLLNETGDISRFIGRFFNELFKRKQGYEEFFRQCYWVGYKSLPLVGITAFIMGLVLTLQSRPTLVEFGTQSLLPAMVSLIREISLVITALICAGKNRFWNRRGIGLNGRYRADRRLKLWRCSVVAY